MSKTAYLIAQAGIDENGNTSGGESGCQNGFELHACRWFSKPWEMVYRAKNEEDREKIADFMERACSNGFIGYSQRNRADMFEILKTNSFRPEMITQGVYCDCSSLAFSALYNVTGIDFIKEVEGTVYTIPNTSMIPEYIEVNCADLFDKFTATEYLESEELLERGDILLKPGSHVGVWI